MAKIAGPDGVTQVNIWTDSKEAEAFKRRAAKLGLRHDVYLKRLMAAEDFVTSFLVPPEIPFMKQPVKSPD